MDISDVAVGDVERLDGEVVYDGESDSELDGVPDADAE
jgi:2-methylaconitate cis-trans-isomerase PrpF